MTPAMTHFIQGNAVRLAFRVPIWRGAARAAAVMPWVWVGLGALEPPTSSLSGLLRSPTCVRHAWLRCSRCCPGSGRDNLRSTTASGTRRARPESSWTRNAPDSPLQGTVGLLVSPGICCVRSSNGACPGSYPAKEQAWLEQMPHGYTNMTTTDSSVVTKSYQGVDATRRCDREAAVLTALAERLPVPPVLRQDSACLRLGMLPGQHIDHGQAEPVLRACGLMLRRIHAIHPWDVPALGATSGPAVLVHGDYGRRTS